MTEVETLIGYLLAPYRELEPAERLSYSAALQRHAGVDAHRASDGDLTESARRHGIVCHAELDRRCQARPVDGPRCRSPP